MLPLKPLSHSREREGAEREREGRETERDRDHHKAFFVGVAVCTGF